MRRHRDRGKKWSAALREAFRKAAEAEGADRPPLTVHEWVRRRMLAADGRGHDTTLRRENER